MPQVLVHFDQATLNAIDRITAAAKRKRAAKYTNGNRTRSTTSEPGTLPKSGRNEAIRDLVGRAARTGREASRAAAQAAMTPKIICPSSSPSNARVCRRSFHCLTNLSLSNEPVYIDKS